jgi:hypothetical protein
MRYITSRPFLIGLFLVLGAFVAMPPFVTELTGQGCTTPTPTNPSWDCVYPVAFDFTVPVLAAASGVTLMLVTIVRTRSRSGE